MATGMSECSPALLVAAGLAVLAICSYLAAIVVGRGAARYPPVVGTVFHQVYHLHRLHDYYTDLFREYATFRLLAPGRTQIYTSDTAVVEHILRTNFANYGKASNLSLPRFINLETSMGCGWRVELKQEEDGKLELGALWCAFAKFHGIKLGCVAEFEVVHPELMKVIIYNEAGIEVTYTLCGDAKLFTPDK